MTKNRATGAQDEEHGQKEQTSVDIVMFCRPCKRYISSLFLQHDENFYRDEIDEFHEAREKVRVNCLVIGISSM